MFHVPAHKQVDPAKKPGQVSLAPEVSPAQPVAVVYEPELRVVDRLPTVGAAEAFIAELEKTEPEAVHAGLYGIDAPESHIQA